MISWNKASSPLRRRHVRGRAEFPRIRAAPRGLQLGRDAQPGGTSIHGGGAKLVALAWTLPDAGRFQFQHVRRCGAGSVRSPTSWWRGQLRHRKEETQTRLALQTAPPLRLARSSLPNRVAKPNPPHGLKASGRRLHNTRHLLHICFLLRWRAAAVVLHLATAVSLAGSPSVRHSPT